MTLSGILIFLFASSLVAMAAVFSVKLYLVRNLKKEEFYEGIVSSEPFFKDFERFFLPVLKFFGTGLGFLAGFFKKFFWRIGCLVAPRVKFYKCRLSNYIQGRHTLTNNGCAGYWEELNQCKNGKKGNGKSAKK